MNTRHATLCLLLALSLAPLSPAALGTLPATGGFPAPDDAPSLANIAEIAAPGTPGELAVWGPAARVLVAGKEGDHLVPVAASGTLGQGRVVALVHTGMLEDGSASIADTSAFLDSIIRWAAKRDSGKGPQPKVGLINCRLADLLKARGIESVPLKGEWETQLSRETCDAVCINGNAANLSDKQVEALISFAKRGGGILAAQTAWAWNAPAGKTILDNPLNRVFASSGIAWTQGYSGKTGEKGFVVKNDLSPMLHASNAIEALVKAPADTKPTEEIDLAAKTATAAARHLPRDDKLLRPKLIALLKESETKLVPSPKAPLTDKQPLLRTLLAMQVAELAALSPQQVKPHPAAAVFPGAVPDDAKRVAVRVPIDARIPDWHSTGLYAAPGQVVTINIPEPATGAKLAVRIGCHTDQNWHHSKWDRVPEITRSWPLTSPTTGISSPFGGPIYIEVPQNCTINECWVAFAGAVEAPIFTLGKTTTEAWKNIIRTRPAPWAELGTSKVVISVPSSAIRDLDDPEALLKAWDEVMDAAADLATIPRQRKRPERYVMDQQISAGYMHSGYPIMTHMDVGDDFTKIDKLKAGSWGLFHEMGHNHQSHLWTFDGTGEVTVNLFSLYIMETVCGKGMNEGHGAMSERERLVAKHKSRNASFESWKSDPFLALVMYQQLREAFGWETYKKVFAEYRALPDADQPKTEEQKRDQWMTRFSRACGKNLGPFFQAWGVPTSQAARDSVANLPGWMPKDWPGPIEGN